MQTHSRLVGDRNTNLMKGDNANGAVAEGRELITGLLVIGTLISRRATMSMERWRRAADS